MRKGKQQLQQQNIDEKKKLSTHLKIGIKSGAAASADADTINNCTNNNDIATATTIITPPSAYGHEKEMDLQGSDYDSAVSSAPPSLSPQPGNFTNSPEDWNLVSSFLERKPIVIN